MYRGPQKYDYRVIIHPRGGKPETYFWNGLIETLTKAHVTYVIDLCELDVQIAQKCHAVINQMWFDEHTNGLSMKGGSRGTLRIERTPVDHRCSL